MGKCSCVDAISTTPFMPPVMMSRWTDEESGKFQLKNDADPEKSVGLFEIAYIREIRRTGKYFKILKIMLYNNLYDHMKARILLFFEEAAVQNIAVNHFYHTPPIWQWKAQNGQFHAKRSFFWPREVFFGQEKVSWEMIIFFCFVSALFVQSCLQQGLSLISIALEMFFFKNTFRAI